MGFKISAVLGALLCLGLPASPQSDPEAARVNGEVMTWAEVRERLSDVKPENITADLLKAKRRELVESILVRQYADRNHLTVTEAEIDAAVARERKSYRNDEEHQKYIYIRYGSRTAYRLWLRWDCIKKAVYKLALATAATDPALQGADFSPEAVPVEALRKYYDDHQAEYQKVSEQISFLRIGLKPDGPGQKAMKQALAESLLRRLEKGSEFAMMTYFYSDVRRAKDFRDRGVTRTDLKDVYAPETIAYLFDVLKEGEISPIITDGATLNIFKMQSKEKHAAESFEDAQAQIRELLERQVRYANWDKLTLALRLSGKIEPADVFAEK